MARPPWPDLSGKTILQIIPDLSAGGAERTTIEMSEAILAAGGRALVASQGGRLEADLAGIGGELLRLNAGSKNPFTLRANAQQLIKWVTQHQIDLLHARSRAPGWSALWAARATKRPFVTTYHGAYSGTSGLKRRYNSVMARGDMVIANSDWTANHVRQVHNLQGDRIVTIPRGVDLAEFNPSVVSQARQDRLSEHWRLKPGDPRLLLVLPGRLTSWKGQKVAIEAIGALAPNVRAGLHCILTGDAQGRTAYVQELDSRIDALGLTSTLSIVGHTADMPAAYALADIVLAPSTRPEAFGRVAAEASAMARPVIVSDHGGQRETVLEGQTGRRAAPRSVAELSRCIADLVAMSPQQRQAMGHHGRQHVEANFSKQKLQISTLNVYASLLPAKLSVVNLQNHGHIDG